MTPVDPVQVLPGAPVVPSAARRRQGEALAGLWRNPSGRAGCVLVGAVAVAALAAAVGATPFPAQQESFTAPLKGPSFSHVLGTDQFGRDMLSLVMEGLLVSLKISCVAVAIAGAVGTLMGTVAGYLGGWTSAVLMRFTDMLFAIPAILLALAIVTALGPGWFNSALAIGTGYIPIFARVVRGPVLSLRQAPYVRAGQVLGFSRWRLLFRHILPNVGGIIAVQVSMALAWAVLAEASLSFLGLGPPPPTASLGQMVSQASSLAATAWWALAAPSAAIIIAVIGFNLLGDGLRDAIDPRSRS